MPFNSCPSQCVILPPDYASAACEKQVQQGGISNLIIAACDVPDLTLLSLAEICEYARQGRVVMSPSLLGQKPEAETESSDTDSCSDQTITGYKYTLQFESYEYDPVNFSNYTFWNFVKRYYQRYHFYYVTCDGLLHGPVPSPSLKVSHMTEAKRTQKAGHKGTLSWLGYDDLVPVRISGLTQALSGGCVDGPSGFVISEGFPPTMTAAAGSTTPVTQSITILRQSCTQTVEVSVVGIEIISGGPVAPTVTGNSIVGPAGTSGSLVFSFAAASPGIYDVVYRVRGCADSVVGTIRVTVNPAP